MTSPLPPNDDVMACTFPEEGGACVGVCVYDVRVCCLFVCLFVCLVKISGKRGREREKEREREKSATTVDLISS